MSDICENCGGEGTVFESTWQNCTVYPIGECCGGCGHDIECEDCGGTGEIECEYGCDEDALYETNIDGADVMCCCPEHHQDFKNK